MVNEETAAVANDAPSAKVETNVHFDAKLTLFRQDIRQMVRSMVDFALAQRRGISDNELFELAAEVRVYLDGRFQSIDEVYKRCASHGWKFAVYEAWAYETRKHVRLQANRLGQIGADALITSAGDVMEADRASACDAIGEAQEALYGYRTAVLI